MVSLGGALSDPVFGLGDVAGALAGYPHLAACLACTGYVNAVLEELEQDARDGDPTVDQGWPMVPVGLSGGQFRQLVTAWVLSFHESSHRRDARRTALEHFGL